MNDEDPIPQPPSAGTAEPHDECDCVCHTRGGIAHFFPCCYTCSACGMNVPLGAKGDHDARCLCVRSSRRKARRRP